MCCVAVLVLLLSNIVVPNLNRHAGGASKTYEKTSANIVMYLKLKSASLEAPDVFLQTDALIRIVVT